MQSFRVIVENYQVYYAVYLNAVVGKQSQEQGIMC